MQEQKSFNVGSENLLKSLVGLMDVTVSTKLIPFNVITINTKTLCRNLIGKTQNVSKKDINNDIYALIENSTLYLNTVYKKYKNIKPIVIVYNPKYTIPKKYKRISNNAQMILLETIYNEYLNESSLKIRTAKINDVNTIFATVGIKNYPHLELLNIIETFKEDTITYKHKNHLAITHLPLDLHIYILCKNFYLLESYTGVFKSSKLFGMKYFKNENIPFNTITHTVFGDNYQLQSLVTPTLKRKLKQIAEQNRWIYKTTNSISKDIERVAHISITDQNGLSLLH